MQVAPRLVVQVFGEQVLRTWFFISVDCNGELYAPEDASERVVPVTFQH